MIAFANNKVSNFALRQFKRSINGLPIAMVSMVIIEEAQLNIFQHLLNYVNADYIAIILIDETC